MESETIDLVQVMDALDSLGREVARLSDRLAALEKNLPGPVPGGDAGAGDDSLSEETVVVISAAVAAFLGAKPRIRQIRLLRSDSWAQQGRATIQASHVLSFHHG